MPDNSILSRRAVLAAGALPTLVAAKPGIAGTACAGNEHGLTTLIAQWREMKCEFDHMAAHQRLEDEPELDRMFDERMALVDRILAIQPEGAAANAALLEFTLDESEDLDSWTPGHVAAQRRVIAALREVPV